MRYLQAARLQRQVPAQLLLAESPLQGIWPYQSWMLRLANGGIFDPRQVGEGDHLAQGTFCKSLKLPLVGSTPLQPWSLVEPSGLNGAPSGGSKSQDTKELSRHFSSQLLGARKTG